MRPIVLSYAFGEGTFAADAPRIKQHRVGASRPSQSTGR
jgi:hypothetical protein